MFNSFLKLFQVKEIAAKATKKDVEVVPDVAVKPKKEIAVTEEKIIVLKYPYFIVRRSFSLKILGLIGTALDSLQKIWQLLES